MNFHQFPLYYFKVSISKFKLIKRERGKRRSNFLSQLKEKEKKKKKVTLICKERQNSKDNPTKLHLGSSKKNFITFALSLPSSPINLTWGTVCLHIFVSLSKLFFFYNTNFLGRWRYEFYSYISNSFL